MTHPFGYRSIGAATRAALRRNLPHSCIHWCAECGRWHLRP